MNFAFSVILDKIDNGVITFGEFLEDLGLNFNLYENLNKFKYDIFSFYNIDKDLFLERIKKFNFKIIEIK